MILMELFMEVEPMISAYATFRFMVYLWTLIKNINFLFNNEKLIRLLKSWFEFLESTTQDITREKALERALRSSVLTLKHHILTFALPFMSVMIIKLSTSFKPISPTSGTIFMIPSTLIIVLQFVCAVYVVANLCSFPATVEFMLRIINAELEYLEADLHCLVAETKTIRKFRPYDFRETINSHNTTDGFDVIREHLKKWIIHHAHVIKFQRQVNDVFSPLIGGEYLYLVTNVAGLLYCAVSGQLPIDKILLSSIFVCFASYTTHGLCTLGEMLMLKSARVADVAILENWFLFPTDIKKDMILVCLLTQKPMTINLKGRMPLFLQTFRRMAFSEYQLLRFMTDVR